jgi:hypothetical protein
MVAEQEKNWKQAHRNGLVKTPAPGLQDNGIEATFHVPHSCKWSMRSLQAPGANGFSRKTPALTVAANNTQAR